MIKFNKKTKLKHVQDRLDILEQNIETLNNNILNLSSTETYISEEEAYGVYKHFLVDEGDLLISCSGINSESFKKKIAFVKKEHLPLCMNTSTMRFKNLKNKLLLEYLYFFFQTLFWNKKLKKNSFYFGNRVKFYSD